MTYSAKALVATGIASFSAALVVGFMIWGGPPMPPKPAAPDPEDAEIVTDYSGDQGRRRVEQMFGAIPTSARDFGGSGRASGMHDDWAYEDIHFTLPSNEWDAWRPTLVNAIKKFRSELVTFQNHEYSIRATYGGALHRLEVSYWEPTVTITRRYSD